MDNGPEWFDQRAGLARESRKQAIAHKCFVSLDEFVRHCLRHVRFPRPRTCRQDGGLWIMPTAPSCSISFGPLRRSSGRHKQAIRDEAQRSDIDEAAALVDQVQESAIDVRIFAAATVSRRLAVNQPRSAVL